MNGDKVKKKIAPERLIELAESAIPASVEEQKLLRADKSLRRELEELRTLFADLRGQPEPEIDETALAGIVPALRNQIENRRFRSPLALLRLRPVLARAVAAAASLLILVGLSVLVGTSTYSDQDSLVPLLNFASDLELSDPSEDLSDLIMAASSIPDLDLFPEIEDAMVEESADLFIDEAAVALIERALADESTLALLESELNPDREEYQRIQTILNRLEL